MNILAIDSSSKFLCVGISRGSRVIVDYRREIGRRLSKEIVYLIKKTLSKAKISLNEIDVFGVGLGPGSFTGLRIGLSAIKGLNFKLERPVVGISSLDIISRNAIGLRNKFICPVLDAKRKLVYSCIYKKQNFKLKKVSRYLLISPLELKKMIKNDTVFLGDGLTIYKDLLKSNKSSSLKFLKEKFWFPESGQLIYLVCEKIKNTRSLDSLKKEINPLYLYPKECQVRR